jgi:hypothetical protein
METLRTIWADIARDLKQNNADLEIPDAQGMYWTLFVADRLRALHILKRNSGAYLSTFVLPVYMDEVFTTRQYIVLPASIYDFDLDGAVESLSYYIPDSCGPEFVEAIGFRTDPSRSRSRAMSTYQKATPSRFQWWREHDRIYLLGADTDVQNIEAKLYNNLPDIDDVDPDAPFDFPKELISIAKMEILKMGRFALALPGQHLTNDGTNRPQAAVVGDPGKLSSVNSQFSNPDSV